MTVKKKAYVVGNCQARALERALLLSNNFSENFYFVPIQPVHLIKENEVKGLHDDLPSAGLLLAQCVGEMYRNGIGLGFNKLSGLLSPGGLSFSWPSIYWSGYNPELFYFRDERGVALLDTFDYHHRIIIDGYIKGLPTEVVADNLQTQDIEIGSKEAADRSLEELATRESLLDVKVVSYIIDNYRMERLFWTFNHPSQSLIIEVARQILSALGLTDDLPKVAPREYLNSTIYPILPSVRAALDLKFQSDSYILSRGSKLTTLEAVKRYYSIYDKHKNLIGRNHRII